MDSLDLGGPRARRALREMGPRHPYRSAWAGGSAVLIWCCERVVVATEIPQFVVLAVGVKGGLGTTRRQMGERGGSTCDRAWRDCPYEDGVPCVFLLGSR